MKQKRNKTKKPAPKKPASKKKEPPLMCCAGDLCQQQGSGGIIIGSNGHPCVICKERMHSNICSDGKSDNMNGMTCKKCAASVQNNGRQGRKTRATPKQSQPSTTPLSTQTNTRGRTGQQEKTSAVTSLPITRRSRRNIK